MLLSDIHVLLHFFVCETHVVQGNYKAQPLNVSLTVFPRAHELFNFVAQTPAFYRNGARWFLLFLVAVNKSLREIYENPFLFVALADIFTENA